MQIPQPAELLERLAALPAARPLLERLKDDPPVYLVGGAVRDLLLGRQPRELDLLVETDAADVAERIGGSVLVHERFGTSSVRLDGHTYDIARARRETYAHPGALPDVTPAPLAEDLTRRDFTVNAMAFALSDPDAGELRTISGAVEDLGARLLRVLHDRSFIDDPTRLLRLVRYHSRLGFAIEPHTAELARSAVDSRALGTVSGPRVGAELRLLAREPDPVRAFSALGELGLDQAIQPRFGLADPELARRALELLPADGRRDLLVLAAASRQVPGDELRELLTRLGFEAGERDRIIAAATGADALADSLAQATSPSEIADAVAGASPQLVALAGADEDARGAAADWLGRLRHVRLAIDGGDLLAAGVPEGPAVGRGLRAALAAKLDGRARGREAELAEALKDSR